MYAKCECALSIYIACLKGHAVGVWRDERYFMIFLLSSAISVIIGYQRLHRDEYFHVSDCVFVIVVTACFTSSDIYRWFRLVPLNSHLPSTMSNTHDFFNIYQSAASEKLGGTWIEIAAALNDHFK